MTEIFKREYIFLNEQLKNRRQAFEFIAQKSEELGFIDSADKILQALYSREKEAPTGMQDGIAIPHAILPDLKEPAVFFVRSSIPIKDWPAFDDQPITQIIAMLVPKNSEQAHLQVLSDLATALVDEDKRESLVQSQTLDQVYEVLSNNV